MQVPITRGKFQGKSVNTAPTFWGTWRKIPITPLPQGIAAPKNTVRARGNLFPEIISGMCGRYRLSRRKQILAEHFDAISDADDWIPRYNIAPTQPVLVIRQHPTERTRHLSQMRWGLIPSWSTESSGAAQMINARSETAHTLPAFRDAMKYRRCLVPADGFYEWKRSGTTKQPYCFEVRDGELFAFAGLWEGWKDPGGQWIKTCTILTTTPNAVTSGVHDRMPVILDAGDYDLWLDPGMKDAAAISQLLSTLPALRARRKPALVRSEMLIRSCSARVAMMLITKSRMIPHDIPHWVKISERRGVPLPSESPAP